MCIFFIKKGESVMFAMDNQNDDTVISLLIFGAIVVALVAYLKRRKVLTAFGSAEWMNDKMLRAWGMLKEHGLVLGRTMGGALIRMRRYCHILLVGGTGSGKGIGILIPNLLTYVWGSLVAFDPKGDLFATTAKRRQRMGQRILRVAPFDGGRDRLNPLDTIPEDSPLLIDSAGAMAESLVVRTGAEPDPHWNDKAVQVIKAILVFVLLKLRRDDRNLSSVQEIASDPLMLAATAEKLQQIGGIPARLGSQLKGLFDKEAVLSKEGSGVMSTVARHLSFLDSELVARSVADSTFDVRDLLEPGTTLYLQIPPSQLEAQKGLLRCWVSTLIREIGSSGSEDSNEVLMLLDEASALGSLAAVEEALVRGRSAGVRLLLAYQSDSQVKTAFKDKPTLLYDNCSSQIYLKTGSYETAERLSKSLGDWTQWVEGDGTNWSSSGSTGPGGGGGSVSQGGSTSRTQQGRALLRPEEILTLSSDYLIAMLGDAPAPILAQRIKWYEDPYFNPAAKKVWRTAPTLLSWLLGVSEESRWAWLVRRPRLSPMGWLILAVASAIGIWWVMQQAQRVDEFGNPVPMNERKVFFVKDR